MDKKPTRINLSIFLAGVVGFAPLAARPARQLLIVAFASLSFFVAGVVGFEPTDDGVRVRSLTAWRHPNINAQLIF